MTVTDSPSFKTTQFKTTLAAGLEGGVEHQALIARQSIVDREGAIIGYELFDRTRGPRDHTAASDVAMVFSVLEHAGPGDPMGSTPLFVNCTHSSLGGGHLELVQPDKLVLEIPLPEASAVGDIAALTGVLVDVRKRGFRLAFGHAVLAPAFASWQGLADFIKFDLAKVKLEALPALVQMARKESKARLLVEKVETEDQHQRCQALGFDGYQGFWLSRPKMVATKVVTPNQANTLQIINLVRKQASTAEIEEVLKKDAILAFNLMRLINSAGFGLTRRISSFREAIMLLGLKKLFRWAALLLTAHQTSSAPRSVAADAVVRGRLIELLAIEALGPEQGDDAFVTGVFSLLDAMLGVPLHQALALLALPDTVTQAVLDNSGPFAPFLALAKACETNDDQAFADLALQLKLSNHQINLAHLQALAWADSLAQEAQ